MSLEKEPGRLPSEVTPWLGKEQSHELTDNMQLSRAARRLLADSMAKNTILAFRSDIRGFMKAGYSLPATAQQVANYLAEMHTKGRKPATISRHASSLGTWHVYMQLPSPTLSLEVKGVLKGIHRKSDGRQRQAPALRLHHLRQLLKALDLDAPRDLRDASMFCLCFYGAFRASEVVALYREDIEWRDGGIVITLRHSKTNQSGRIEQKMLPRNPAGGVAASDVTGGLACMERHSSRRTVPIHRSGRSSGGRQNAPRHVRQSTQEGVTARQPHCREVYHPQLSCRLHHRSASPWQERPTDKAHQRAS